MKNTQIQTENTHRIVKQGIKQNQKKYPENIETDDPLQTENEVKQTEESDIHTYQQIPRDKINRKQGNDAKIYGEKKSFIFSSTRDDIMFFDAYLLMKMGVCFKKKMIEEEWQ